MGTTLNSRRALKSLGVTMYIPKSVTMEALNDSQLYPEKYLMVVKDYAIRKRGTADEQRTGTRARSSASDSVGGNFASGFRYDNERVPVRPSRDVINENSYGRKNNNALGN